MASKKTAGRSTKRRRLRATTPAKQARRRKTAKPRRRTAKATPKAKSRKAAGTPKTKTRRQTPKTRTKSARKPKTVNKKQAKKRRPAAKGKSVVSTRSRSPNPTAKPRPEPVAKTGPARTTSPKRRGGSRRGSGRPGLSGNLARPRRRLSEAERLGLDKRPREDERLVAAARTGHDDVDALLRHHTESSPALTAGDLDAKWDDAYAVGDEAPGGDNPTPGQDRVDDIGRALGVTYDLGEELAASEKVGERDRHRWELDPASSDDWPHSQD